MTFFCSGCQISAWVSPPQLRASNIVAVAPSMAQAASTAFPPWPKIMAPAVAPSGLPVIAIQCFPWRTGFWGWATAVVAMRAADRNSETGNARTGKEVRFMGRIVRLPVRRGNGVRAADRAPCAIDGLPVACQ